MSLCLGSIHAIFCRNRTFTFQINEDKYMVSNQFDPYLSTDNVPDITMYDIVVGNVNCEGSLRSLHGSHTFYHISHRPSIV
jgi:hypothetical protein